MVTLLLQGRMTDLVVPLKGPQVDLTSFPKDTEDEYSMGKDMKSRMKK
jgi:hypothetical protein